MDFTTNSKQHPKPNIGQIYLMRHTLGKRGPKSYKEKATKQRGAGLVTRRETRKWENASDASLRSVRAGWSVARRLARKYMQRKGIPTTFRRGNIHGGKLWANRNECKMTDKTAGAIIEKVYLSKKATIFMLRQVRHTLSYSYYLKTGMSEDNWPEVTSQWKSFDFETLPKTARNLVAKRIPTPENLKEAFTKPWTPEHPWSLFDFVVGGTAAHDYFVFGARPRVDLDKIKFSKRHVINANERYGYTEMKGGRSKLSGNKNRPWNVYRVCFCKEKKHVSPPEDIELTNAGNPVGRVKWNTVCPLAMMEFQQNLQGNSWRPYPKLNATGFVSRNNQGKVPDLANKWLQVQTHQDPFDPNSGRKSLARWLDFHSIPYEVGFEIHGDLQQIWRNAYQSKLAKSKFEDRCQSRDVDLAAKALRLFAMWLHEGQPRPSIKQQLQAMLANLD